MFTRVHSRGSYIVSEGETHQNGPRAAAAQCFGVAGDTPAATDGRLSGLHEDAFRGRSARDIASEALPGAPLFLLYCAGVSIPS